MSRLTQRDERGWCEWSKHDLTDIVHKLCHYEDLEEQGRLIEIDLNELKRDELDRCTHRHCNKCDKYRLELQLYKDNDGRVKEMIGMDMAEASMRFAALTIAKNEGRLIELPCKVGDTVYEVHDGEIRTNRLGSKWRITRYLEEGFFGESVFTTKAEAEAKLAELKEGE